MYLYLIMYMTDGVNMNTTTGGGVSAGFQRMLTGQNIFISDYTYDGSSGSYGYVALESPRLYCFVM